MNITASGIPGVFSINFHIKLLHQSSLVSYTVLKATTDINIFSNHMFSFENKHNKATALSHDLDQDFIWYLKHYFIHFKILLNININYNYFYWLCSDLGTNIVTDGD